MTESNDIQAPARQENQTLALAIDEASIDLLGRLAKSPEVADTALTQRPGSDMGAMLRSLVDALKRVNVKALLKTEGFLSRLTGADVEARLRFEVAVKELSNRQDELRAKAAEARSMRKTLQTALSQILAAQPQLECAIEEGRRTLHRDNTADTFTRQRFERRLANLSVLHASNAMTCQQIGIAEKNLSLMIDRFCEVDTVIFPLWRREALAIAQARQPLSLKSERVESFLEAHNQFLEKLFGD